MTAIKLIERLSKYDPDTRVFIEIVNRDGGLEYVNVTKIETSNYAESTDEFYDDIDDAMEEDGFDGELEEVVIII